ncbi:MAG: galactose ABC transporter substrate-binding protein [Erysipelotrichaceae bacterium]|nr:galactose ABC transporter substrate-binding protein [Erysipelotrichaceae bacterium]
MKKLLTLLVALLMVFSLAACSSKTDNNTTTGGGNDVKEVNIGVAIYQFNDNFMTLYRGEIAKYFDALNAKDSSVQYKVTIVDGKNDAGTQTEQINTFIAQGVDALIVNMVQPSTIEAVSDAASSAGIPVVFINREPEDAEAHKYPENECYVGAKAQESGTYQGQIIYDLPNHGDVNGNGVVDYVMIMGDVNNTDAQYRTEYSIKYLTDNGVAVNELFKQTGNWDQAQGQELAANALSTFGDEIDVIFCNNDGMALGAYQSIVAAGRTVGEDIYLVGVDALDECVEMVNNGTMTGTVLNDAVGQANAACDAVVGYLNGAEVATYQYVPYVMVRK